MPDLTQPKPTPADNLRQFERDVFDALGALTTALSKGMVVNVSLSLAGSPIGMPQITIFLPSEAPGQPPTPKRFRCPEHGPTFLHLLAAAGDELHQQLLAWHSNTGAMDGYLQEREQIAKLREPPPRIIVPRMN